MGSRYGHLFPWGPLSSWGEPGIGRGCSLKDECRRAEGMGHRSARYSMKGPLREDSFNGDPESYVK